MIFDRKQPRIMTVSNGNEAVKEQLLRLVWNTDGASRCRSWGKTTVLFDATAKAYLDILAHVDGTVRGSKVDVTQVHKQAVKWTVSEAGIVEVMEK